jgi:hypothetical protein
MLAMRWPGGRVGGLLAGLYLVAFCCLVVSLAWVLYRAAVVPMVLFGAAGLAMWLLALRLQDGVPRPARGGRMRLSGYQRAWYRLVLGLEIPVAVRLVTGRGPVA